MIFSLFLLSASFYFSGCEGDFRAKRNFNSENLAGPYQMRIVTIDATNYLAVSNSNVNFSYSNGSLQFFSLASPAAPVRVAAMDLALPTNISDFWIYTDAGTDEWLFILDRNQAQVLVYKYDGTKFTPRLDASGEATAIS
ncbi:MAG: hypothetical protein J0L93_09770, partial [Deltaproteobacteria bacterium]|nr:hypothetical protein [Deltaproteobacteria bacterium]